ncbi:MAG: hypothetical protein O7E56_15775 [SAR324 cluster bacterium]|nr:hypothetical protein [SAR324 cluster bacterium]MCZ6556603.1 hypothetical protein [SAR324 cluster bacterium]MCZ6629679.1 hypothetical protein [SAR324 cluster bacterium]MCZ6644686.1 hypothetical protein [SAR324 cluster bacterium]
MPKYFEYVFAAYAIWIGGFGFYLAHLYRKSRRIARALQQLPEESGKSSGSP